MPTYLIIDQGGQLTTLRDNIGPQGQPGSDGVGSEWITGAGAPSNSLGENGDLYLDTTNGDVYQKFSGSWTLVANLAGTNGVSAIANYPLSGSYYGVTPFRSLTGLFWQATDKRIYQPFWLGVAGTYDQIIFEVITAGAAGAEGYIALFDNNDGTPGTLLDDATLALDGAPAVQTISLNGGSGIALDAGLYWIERFGNAGTSPLVIRGPGSSNTFSIATNPVAFSANYTALVKIETYSSPGTDSSNPSGLGYDGSNTLHFALRRV